MAVPHHAKTPQPHPRLGALKRVTICDIKDNDGCRRATVIHWREAAIPLLSSSILEGGGDGAGAGCAAPQLQILTQSSNRTVQSSSETVCVRKAVAQKQRTKSDGNTERTIRQGPQYLTSTDCGLLVVKELSSDPSYRQAALPDTRVTEDHKLKTEY